MKAKVPLIYICNLYGDSFSTGAVINLAHNLYVLQALLLFPFAYNFM